MNRVRTGELPWTKLDALHRMTLDRLLVDFSITGLSDAEKDELNRAWHRLTPWPDSVGGLTRLKKKFIIAPLSNGNISLMTDLARHGGLPWDCILGAELVRHYKPDPEVYQSAADILDLTPRRRDDGGGAPRGPARVEEGGTTDGVRPAAQGIWASRKAGPEGRRVSGSFRERLQRSGCAVGRLASAFCLVPSAFPYCFQGTAGDR